jgi:putative acetyltransferase
MLEDRLVVRLEQPENRTEQQAIRSVNESAFGGNEEADLVDRLRAEGHTLISLVAGLHSHIVGHVLFSRMWIETQDTVLSAVALAPVAVLPEHQRRGIGQRLIQHGLDLLRERGEAVVIVVGHPDYYPRFGFSSEKAKVLESPFPGDAFMALELTPGALREVRGRVEYPDAFGI